jgi:hypothetical protein
MKKLGKRMEEKKIVGNMKGEGVTTGGFLIFGSDGDPKYMFKEEPGVPMEEAVFVEAAKVVREGQSSPAKADL